MRRTIRLIVIGVACLALLGIVVKFALNATVVEPPEVSEVARARVATPLDVAERIYEGRLNPGWQDAGWGRHDLTAGSARVVFAGYAGIIFRHTEIATPFSAFAFRYKAPGAWSPFLTVRLRATSHDERDFPQVDVTGADIADVGDGWKEALFSWSRLNPRGLPIDGITISASRQVGPEWVELDKVVLTKAHRDSVVIPTIDADLMLLCDEQAKQISPQIYGVSMEALETGGTANRIGGNPMSRLNWELGPVWNAGKDWFFENAKGEGSVSAWVDDATAHGALSAVVVPMIGWVAKDTTSVGFPVSKFGKQRSHDPYRPEAGNGERPDGTPLKPGSPTETSVAAPPDTIARWVSALRDHNRARGARNVYMYILDNEPGLWDATHRDVHPDPVGYDELLDRTLRYAAAIRAADPESLIAGPAEWGWTGYLYSAKDRAAGIELHPDRRMHGNQPLVEWYLAELAEHEKKTGVRLLDVLDLHFYPQAEGIFGVNARTDAEASELRLRSTRALWDAKYVDESWIREPVRLIPRMQEWVARHYPGMKTSIGEWSFGADNDMSGALAAAESLGRFGQHGLDSAFFWPGPKPDTKVYWAFRAFRNFDGSGGRFLDWSVPTKGADKVSLFASRDESGAHLVVIALNLNPNAAYRAHVDTTACGKLQSLRTYMYDGGHGGLTKTPGAPATTGIAEVLPPYSITVFDLAVAK